MFKKKPTRKELENEIEILKDKLSDLEYIILTKNRSSKCDYNNIMCSSGNNNLNFWYLSNSKLWKIPFLMAKTKNFVDHCFYKFKNRVIEINGGKVTADSGAVTEKTNVPIGSLKK